MITMTLEQQVFAVLSGSVGTWGSVSGGALEKVPEGRELEEFDHDLLDWGVAYGIALGIARMDDPCEPIESVVWRAKKAAWKAYVLYGHGFNCAPTYPTDELKALMAVTA